jgi:beta-fructofuranosidase
MWFSLPLLAVLASVAVVGALAYVEARMPIGMPNTGNYTGALRPHIHFSPPRGFMNDPNGMFLDAEGLFHLYYQYERPNL